MLFIKLRHFSFGADASFQLQASSSGFMRQFVLLVLACVSMVFFVFVLFSKLRHLELRADKVLQFLRF
jgi:hypothetical protein